MNSILSDNSDFALEYQDAVKDPANPVNQQIESTVPEKYKGKQVEDLINMHVNLEKVLHRQGNELGQLRKLTDNYAQILEATKAGHVVPGQGTTAEPTRKEPLTAESLLTRPEESVNAAIAQNPSVAQNAQRLSQLELSLARKDFEGKYGSYKEDVQNESFQQWVTASQLRSKLLVNLNNYDFESGKELWELWTEHKTAKDAASAAIAQKVSAASTVRSSSSEVSQLGKPIYSRAKLAELQLRAERGISEAVARWNDPEFQREYQLAYQEDRVR